MCQDYSLYCAFIPVDIELTCKVTLTGPCSFSFRVLMGLEAAQLTIIYEGDTARTEFMA